MHDLDPVFEDLALHARAGAGRAKTSACQRRWPCRACTSSSSRGSAARSAATRTRRSCTPSRSRSPASGSRSRTPPSRTGACGSGPAGTGPLRQLFQRRRLRRRRHKFDSSTHAAADSARWPHPARRPAGTMVVLHGLLPHWSDVNRSPVSRHAYWVHCIDASRLPRLELAPAPAGRCPCVCCGVRHAVVAARVTQTPLAGLSLDQ